MENKFIVSVKPLDIDNWVEENELTLHLSSLNSTRELLDTRSGDGVVLLMEFEWMGETYAKIYSHVDNMPDALRVAEEYFASEDMFEEAIEARDLIPKISEYALTYDKGLPGVSITKL
jgi:hypothetical protein